MGMNIKNERVHNLAREAAQVTGGSVTSAVEEALVMLLAHYGRDPEKARAQQRIDLSLRIAASYAADPGMQNREIRTVEDLFDEHDGLPR